MAASSSNKGAWKLYVVFVVGDSLFFFFPSLTRRADREKQLLDVCIDVPEQCIVVSGSAETASGF
jgi:hypothetical protein